MNADRILQREFLPDKTVYFVSFLPAHKIEAGEVSLQPIISVDIEDAHIIEAVNGKPDQAVISFTLVHLNAHVRDQYPKWEAVEIS